MADAFKIIAADGREYSGSLEEIRLWVTEGRVGRGTLVWHPEEQRWQTAAAWPELSWDLPPPLEAPPVVPELVPAGFLPRLAAYGFDFMVLNVTFSLITLPWRTELEALGKSLAAQYDINRTDPMDPMVVWKAFLILAAVYAPLSMAYWVGFNGRLGASPGKALLGMRILAVDGSPLGYRRAFARYCAEMLCLLSFGLGYLVMFLSPIRQALHDQMAGTRVVFRRIF
jgi:uncharacterized RDD family membrane protein YckC